MSELNALSEIRNSEQIKLQPEDITPEYLKGLADLLHEVSMYGQDGGPIQNTGKEFSTDDLAEVFRFVPSSNALLHSHPKHGSTIISEGDIAANERHLIISPGVRSFVITTAGISEYGIQDTALEQADIRDWMITTTQKYRLNDEGIDMDERMRRWNEAIHKAGFVKQEIQWTDTEKIQKLVLEMRDLLSTPKKNSRETSSPKKASFIRRFIGKLQRVV